MTNDEIVGLVGQLVQLQLSTQQQLKELGEHIDLYVTASDARMKELGEHVGAYVTASNTRMERMEKNLDALIRAITAEHTNGKSK